MSLSPHSFLPQAFSPRGSAPTNGSRRGSRSISASACQQEEIAKTRALIERRLDQLVPSETCEPQALHRAMRYSLLAGGKRLRPLMTVLTAVNFGARIEAALDPACAIEMIHTASLILDDMPCMDDAATRRGRPANHRAFGESTAALASTALLARSFGVIAETESLDDTVRRDLVALLSTAVGSDGMIAGQYLDLHPAGRNGRTDRSVLQMYIQKTGALFVAAVETGARIARIDEIGLDAVRRYAINFGLAFQIFDDLLDRFGSAGEIGKDTSRDIGKRTAVSCLGPDRARFEV
ncbi:MAG: polyprenyl synthetase family protein, partial [Acidobacteriota bacterium]